MEDASHYADTDNCSPIKSGQEMQDISWLGSMLLSATLCFVFYDNDRNSESFTWDHISTEGSKLLGTTDYIYMYTIIWKQLK